MAAELGQTNDPTALIPGNAESIYTTEGALIEYGDLLVEAGTGLRQIDTTTGWSGAAADAFRKVYHGQPSKWLQAGAAFHDAANALDNYAATLSWAQQEAATAINMWRSGKTHHQAATATLVSARSQLKSAGSAAAEAVTKAADLAPPKPGFWSQVGSFFSGLGHDAKAIGGSILHGAETAGADTVDTLASIGNAAINDPGGVVASVAGTALAGISAGGEGLGVALDATGIGAVAGVPLNVVSAAGIAAGSSIAAAGLNSLAQNAAGPDRISPLKADSGGGSGTSGGDDEPTTPQTKQQMGAQAKKLGYDQRISPKKVPFNSHGMPVYSNGENYITPDRDAHNVTNGWKLFDRRGNRLGTYSWNLTRLKG
jgi:hypothetical protein